MIMMNLLVWVVTDHVLYRYKNKQKNYTWPIITWEIRDIDPMFLQCCVNVGYVGTSL